MEAFTKHTGRAVPLRRSNVDTDQIIPAVWLKRIERTGYDKGLFETWRSDPDFVLNKEEYAGATILVAGPEFGTGSSREHAVWALQDYGFAVILSSRFADIFRGNSGKAGLLTAVIPQDTIEIIWNLCEMDPKAKIDVDLEQCVVTYDNVTVPFEIDSYVRWRLLQGLDDIDITLTAEDDISLFEKERLSFMPMFLSDS